MENLLKRKLLIEEDELKHSFAAFLGLSKLFFAQSTER